MGISCSLGYAMSCCFWFLHIWWKYFISSSTNTKQLETHFVRLLYISDYANCDIFSSYTFRAWYFYNLPTFLFRFSIHKGMKPSISYGDLSRKEGKAWTCMNCGDYNRPIRKRIFAIPQFKCACGREVSLLHCMNYQLYIPLVSFLYRCFLSISNWRIMTCTSLWRMLKSVGLLWFPSSLTRKAVSNPHEQCYITDCQFLHCFACNIFFFCII